jgi:membrane-bound serine protease (ClpP class)
VVDGDSVSLEVAGAEVRVIEMTALQRLFNFLASPDVAVLLVMAGLLGLYIEFNQPGMLVPGVVGGICLVLAAIAFQILPFSWVGLMLVMLGLGLAVAEIFVSAYGLLLALGLLCFLFGGSMLFDLPEVSDLTVSFWSVLVPLVVGFGAFAALILYAVGRTFLRKQTAGVSELIGQVGRAATPLAPDGRVFVRGEYWNAKSDEPITADEPVEITAVEGMRLRVRRPMQEN